MRTNDCEELQRPNKKGENILSWLVLIAFTIIIGTTLYLIFIDANPPIVLNNEPLPINKSVATAGEVVTMTSEFCKFTDGKSDLSAFWQRESDGLIWALSRNISLVSNEGCYTLTIPLLIPSDIPEGRWKRVNIAEYDVNILTSRVVHWESEYIEIKNP